MNTLWQNARNAPPSQIVLRKKCPSCQKAMTEVATTGTAALLPVDVCTSCHFLWFDRDETALLPALKVEAQVEKPPEMPQAAREALAIAQVQLMARQAERERDISGDPPDGLWQRLAGLFGLPLHEDAPDLARYPFITYAVSVAILTLGVFVTLQGLQEWIETFGFVPAEPGRLGGLAPLTAFFVQPGVVPLIVNFYFFLSFARNVEDATGHGKFVLLLLGGIFAGAFMQVLTDGSETRPMVGAIGGISAVVAYYALAFPHVRLVFAWRYFVWVRWIRVPCAFALIAWVGLTLVFASEWEAGITMNSALAHFAGAIAGVFFYLIDRSIAPRMR